MSDEGSTPAGGGERPPPITLSEPRSPRRSARELPRLHAQLVGELSVPEARRNVAAIIGAGAGPEDMETESHLSMADDVIDGVANGELFFLTADFLEIVTAAAPEVPEFLLHPSDLPALHALVVFEHAISVPIHAERRDWVSAISWITYAAADRVDDDEADLEEGGIFVAVWISPLDEYDVEGWGRYPEIVPSAGARWSYGEHWRPVHGVMLWPGWLGAILRLVGEEYISEQRQGLDRAERRRRQRAGLAVPEGIRIIDVRRRARGEAAPGAGSGVEWSHRWLVRPHWRNQWYPSQGRHAPRWVRGHVKGPEDKPVVARPTVYRASAPGDGEEAGGSNEAGGREPPSDLADGMNAGSADPA